MHRLIHASHTTFRAARPQAAAAVRAMGGNGDGDPADAEGDSQTAVVVAPVVDCGDWAGSQTATGLNHLCLTTDDIDLFEINEAFAVVAAKFVRDLELDWDKVNVNGGSIALGHPIGATGSILIGTVIDEVERRGGRYGLVTMCAAGGMAPAIIVERVDGFVD